MTLTVRVIAPTKTVWDAPAEEVILPSTTGQLGILSGHAPMLTALDIGVMRVRSQSGWTPIALMGGFAEVEANELTILVTGAEQGDTIDLNEAKSAYQTAEKALETVEGNGTDQEKIKAKKEMKRARARYQAAGGMVQA